MDSKGSLSSEAEPGKASLEESRSIPTISPLSRGWAVLARGSELRGVAPIEVEERIAPRYWSNFTLWSVDSSTTDSRSILTPTRDDCRYGMNATIACFATGTLAPLLFGLSFEASAYTIVGFNLFSCSIPSFIALFGPRLGLRTITVARYSFGYWFAIVPAILNLASFIGFCVCPLVYCTASRWTDHAAIAQAVNSIVGGQTLAAINPGNISVTVGIVIIALCSLVISWTGYRMLHAFERYACTFCPILSRTAADRVCSSGIPVTIAFIILLGVSGSKLPSALAFESVPTTAANVLSFASIVVGFSLSWAGCSADFNTYLPSDIPAGKLVATTFLGLYLPSVGFQIVGAAFGAAALSGEIPSWSDAFATSSVGGLLGVALIEPLGGFGKFLLVILALGIISQSFPPAHRSQADFNK